MLRPCSDFKKRACFFSPSQDGVGPENQSGFGALHRDGEEEEGEGLPRYLTRHSPPHLLFCPQMSRLNRAGVHLFVSVRSQRATGIGRLMVNIVEGIELKPCRSHGRNTPPVHKYVTIITTGTMEVRAPVNIHVRL